MVPPPILSPPFPLKASTLPNHASSLASAFASQTIHLTLPGLHLPELSSIRSPIRKGPSRGPSRQEVLLEERSVVREASEAIRRTAGMSGEFGKRKILDSGPVQMLSDRGDAQDRQPRAGWVGAPFY